MDGGIPGTGSRDQAVVIEANALSTTRAVLVAWPLVLIVGLVVTLLAGSIVPVAIAALLFAGLGWFAWPRVKTEWLWGRPHLRLDAPVFRLGEDVHFAFEQSSRRPIDVASASLTTKLICEEHIEWTTGTGDNRKTHSRDAVVVSTSNRHDVVPTPTGLESVGTINVPTEAGAPTLHFDDHRIAWRLETKLAGNRLPSGTETFEVTVVPELAAPIQDTPVQDTVEP